MPAKQPAKAAAELEWTGRPFGGVIADIKRRAPYFASDWVDAFRPENLQLTFSAIYYLFFVCLSPALAFGTLMADATDDQIGVVETILSTAIVGILYSITAGQPLCIQGATGPELAYTIVFYNLCDSMDIEFLPARVWQGFWCGLFTVILALTDCCAAMSHFTRFIEDIFAALISLIFLVSAGKNVVYAYNEDSHDVAFLTTLLCLGTFFLTMWLKSLKETDYTTRNIRKTLANFSAPIAILVLTLIAQLWKDKVKIDFLDVPEDFEPTWPKEGKKRDWFVSPFGIDKDFPVWAIFATAVPAMGLAILGYLDQNLTTIIVNRPASGLKKPGGYHLDLLMCGIFVYPLLALFGLPFTHNSTAPSLIHLMALTNYQDARNSQGQVVRQASSRKVVTGVVEQRFSNFAIHLLIGVSLALSPVLREVPKSVTFGIFLVMGWTSMAGNQLLERVFLWLIWTPEDYPRYNFVTRVARKKMHLYTFIQFMCFAILYAMTEIKQVAVVFPFFMGSLVFVRKALPCIFTQEELEELDAKEDKPMDEPNAPVTMTAQAVAAQSAPAVPATPAATSEVADKGPENPGAGAEGAAGA